MTDNVLRKCDNSSYDYNTKQRYPIGCPAAGMVQVADHNGRDLVFCGHHYHNYEIGLTLHGFKVTVDNRPGLTASPIPTTPKKQETTS